MIFGGRAAHDQQSTPKTHKIKHLNSSKLIFSALPQIVRRLASNDKCVENVKLPKRSIIRSGIWIFSFLWAFLANKQR